MRNRNCYTDSPSVTEDIQIINKPDLNEWYKRNSYSYILHRSQLEQDIGNAVHMIISKSTQSKTGKCKVNLRPEIIPAVDLSIQAYKYWQSKHPELIPIASEYYVRSAKNGYQGRIDRINKYKGTDYYDICDWKTAYDKIYPTTFLQLAAYACIFEEQFPEKRVITIRAVSLGKVSGEPLEAVKEREKIARLLEIYKAARVLNGYMRKEAVIRPGTEIDKIAREILARGEK